MATLDTLKTADLNQFFKSSQLKKSRGLTSQVMNEERRGNSLRADVRGNRLYGVEIEVDEGGLHALCNCPYDWGGYCKHVGAVLLKWLESPEMFAIQLSDSRSSGEVLETIPVKPPASHIPQEVPYWTAVSFEARCRDYDEFLSDWLREYRVQDLRQIAAKQGWSLKGNRKDEIVRQLVEQMLRPGNLMKCLLGQDEEHLLVYQALYALYPGIPYQYNYLEALVGKWGTLTRYKQIQTYIEQFYASGLVISPAFQYDYFHHIASIPASFGRVLPPQLAGRVPEADLPSHSESEVRLAAPKSFLQTFHQVLLLLEQTSPPLRPPLPRPHLEKYHPFLQEWDYIPQEIAQAKQNNQLGFQSSDLNLTVPPPNPPLPDDVMESLLPIVGSEEQLIFIYHLLLAVGLLLPGSPVTVWRELKEQFYRRNEAEQWAIILETYFGLLWWNEIWLVLSGQPELQVKRAKSTHYTMANLKDFYDILRVFRSQIIHLLAGLQDDRWYAVSEVADLLQVLLPRFDSWCWIVGRYSIGSRPGWFIAENDLMLDTATNEKDWERTHGAFLRQVILGPLHWMGAADIVLERGELIAFRLHGLHDLYFDKVESVPLAHDPAIEGQAETADVPIAEPVVVEDLRILVDPTAVSTQTHAYFDTIARLDSVDPKKFIYFLDVAAVHQSFEGGQTLTQMVEGWQTSLNIPMPKAVLERLSTWWKAYGRVRLYEKVTVIEFGDEYALAEMKATTSLQKYLVAEISPSLVIIQESAVNTLVAELERAGYTPKQTDDDN